jgi:NDP-sugar pyrophosphorylase family protein
VKIAQNVQIDEEALAEKFRQRLGRRMQVSINYVDQIMRGANGKFKSVVCLIKDDRG